MDMPFNKKRKIEENAEEVPQEVPELSEAIGGKTDLINSCLPGGGASGGGGASAQSPEILSYHIPK
jgi:hypothetical protein